MVRGITYFEKSRKIINSIFIFTIYLACITLSIKDKNAECLCNFFRLLYCLFFQKLFQKNNWNNRSSASHFLWKDTTVVTKTYTNKKISLIEKVFTCHDVIYVYELNSVMMLWMKNNPRNCHQTSRFVLPIMSKNAVMIIIIIIFAWSNNNW